MIGKQHYDNISVPEQLNDVMDLAQRKARQKQRQTNRIVRYSSLIAACIAFLLIVNIPTVANAMYHIPVLGSIVKVLQFGKGGEVTDGAHVETKVTQNSVQIHFSQDGKESMERVPAYEVVQKDAPNRLIFTINGARSFDYDQVTRDLLKLPLVKEVYRVTILDDSAMRFVVELKDGVSHTVTEYQNPGYLELTLQANAVPTKPHMIFALRTEHMPMGESLSLLEELYPNEDISFIKTSDEQYAAVIGNYATKEEAEAKLKQINAESPDNHDFHVDSWMSNEKPK